MKRGAEADVYDVFVRFGEDRTAPIHWVGSVRSGDPELAWLAAKEIYTRREDPSLLWVARCSEMVKSGPEDAEGLRSAARLGYRIPAFPGQHRRARLNAVAAIEGGP